MMCACAGQLVCFHDAWRFPGAFSGREDRGRFGLGPVESHDKINEVVRRGEPVALFVRAGTVFLDVEGSEPSAFFFMFGNIGELMR
jgi:hypothetical protein